MNIFEEPKIDGHCHVLDPQHFPYAADVAYRPQGQETGSADYFSHVMGSYGVRHALLVGPNSGYGFDNRCLLDAIQRGHGRFKGIAVVRSDTSTESLGELKAQGIVGIAFNVALHGFAYYADIERLLKRMAALGLWAQFQVEGDQLLELLPLLARSEARAMFDHGGRPILAHGIGQSGFQALLELGRHSSAVVKLSGFAKYSMTGYPFADTRPYLDALVDAFGLDRCIWASDWPYLKAPYRLDYGVLLKLVEQQLNASDRRKVLWDTPQKLFGFQPQ